MERREEYHELMLELREFIAKAEQRQIQTEEWRGDLSSHVHDINCKLENLPCKERSGIYENLQKNFDTKYEAIMKHIEWIWFVLSVGIIGTMVTLITEYIKARIVR